MLRVPAPPLPGDSVPPLAITTAPASVAVPVPPSVAPESTLRLLPASEPFSIRVPPCTEVAPV